MATSSSEEDSVCAPTDFSVATSLDESTYSVNFVNERCPLCCRANKVVYCGVCVKSGHFNHSKYSSSPCETDSFLVKRQRLADLEEEHKLLTQRFEDGMTKRMRIIKKRSELLLAREKIVQLKKAVSAVKEAMNDDRALISSEQESNSIRATHARKHSDKMARIRRYIDLTRAYMLKQSSMLDDKLLELMSVRRELITLLLMYIFPVEEVKPRMETDSMVMSTVSALAEARRMSYVGGRWIYVDNGSETKYRIVEPCLPGNGDYSVYNMWKSVKGAVSGQEVESDVTERSPAHTISAALCFTTQLVNILAAILDVHLPKRLCYSEFCGDDLAEQKFSSLVLKLNQNILTLCSSQHVPPEMLHPQHSLHNVLQLVQAQQLGRSQPYEMATDQMQEIIDESYFTYTSDTDSDPDDTDRDWETVPTNLPEVEVPSGSSYTSGPGGSNLYEETMTSAGGFVSSAAAFGASLWRAATGQGAQGGQGERR